MDELGLATGIAVRRSESRWRSLMRSVVIGWWDASDLSTITEAAGKVSQLDDKSGNGNHMTQASGSLQPTTGTRSQNGLNVLDFVPSNRLASPLHPTKPHTMFAVGKGDGGVANAFDDGFLAARWKNGIDHHISFNQRGWGRFQNGQNNMVAADATVPRLLSGSEVSGGSPNARAWLNGSLIGTNSGATLDWNANLRWGLGGPAPLPLSRHYLNGWIGEAIICSVELADADRQLFENYLLTKWGI